VKNIRVLLVAFSLILLAAAIVTFKIVSLGQTFRPEYGRDIWNVVIQMNLISKGERARVRLTLPQDNARQTIYHEDFIHNLGFAVNTRPRSGNRVGFWSTDLLDRNTSIRYSFSTQLTGLRYPLSATSRISRHPEKVYDANTQSWLKPSKDIQSKSHAVLKYVKKIVGREKKTAAVVRRIFDFVRGEVKYRSEKGSKTAKETLNALVADCGGQARLFVAFSRAAGIPSRIAGGIVLDRGVKSITHVWAENYIDGVWVPFDVVNNHFAEIPNHYLELYRGDYVLIKHLGLAQFDYFFVISRGSLPPVDKFLSLYSLPLHFQNAVKLLLLIPIGALVVTIFRVIIGMPTFGTFAPIILALAFREISLGIGLACLALMVTVGCLLRKLLDALKILVIPRISLVVTVVVLMAVGIMLGGNFLGEKRLLHISLFPMIIITWTIERFSVLQIEDGTFTALKTALGTTIVALAAYFLMGWPDMRFYLFTFPEILLAVIGLLLLFGRYTGLRLSELWRFRELRKIQSENPKPA
jgi:hypothetical protein